VEWNGRESEEVSQREYLLVLLQFAIVVVSITLPLPVSLLALSGNTAVTV